MLVYFVSGWNVEGSAVGFYGVRRSRSLVGCRRGRRWRRSSNLRCACEGGRGEKVYGSWEVLWGEKEVVERFGRDDVVGRRISSTGQELIVSDVAKEDEHTEFDDVLETKGMGEQAFLESVSLLNEGQRLAFDTVTSGGNAFITGSGGTGKSFVLKLIVYALKRKYGSACVAVTAMTGVAAELISGCTLHAMLGISSSNDVERLFTGSQTEIIEELEVLILDEVSMLSGELLDHIDTELKTVRGNVSPFGGVQMVFCGDFYQLPPVDQSRLLPSLMENFPEVIDRVFLNRGLAFESNAWMHGQISTIHLQSIERQKDAMLHEALTDIRMGKYSAVVRKLFNLVSRPLEADKSGVQPTKLFATGAAANDYNTKCLNALDEEMKEYLAVDDTEISAELSLELDKVKLELQKLKKDEAKDAKNAKLRSERILLERKYEKLDGKVASAMSMLRKQTFFKSCRALPKIFLCVGAQVMLLKNLSAQQKLVNGSQGVVTGFSEEDMPIVKFRNGVELEIASATFEMNIAGVGACSREQLPLALSYAITIHKSQGQTLDRYIVDLKQVFNRSQTYVALSRATSIDGLQISAVGNPLIHPNTRVDNFFSDLAAAEFLRTETWMVKAEQQIVSAQAKVATKTEKEAQKNLELALKQKQKEEREAKKKQREAEKLERRQEREAKRATKLKEEAEKAEKRREMKMRREEEGVA